MRKTWGDHGIYLTSNDSDCDNSAIIRLCSFDRGRGSWQFFDDSLLSLSSMISSIIPISKERRVDPIVSWRNVLEPFTQIKLVVPSKDNTTAFLLETIRRYLKPESKDIQAHPYISSSVLYGRLSSGALRPLKLTL